MSEYERCKQDVAEAESSCATRQSTIFEYIDPAEYGYDVFDDMINGERTMIHYSSDVCGTHQSTLYE
ncbi:MAG: hypothetical protein ACTSPB_18630 [Candidatus Thorarchaeota archaeon]